MTRELKKVTLRPPEVEAVYGIPEGSLANMRYKKTGPKFFKAGLRRVVYRIEDIENWLNQSPVFTSDSIEARQ